MSETPASEAPAPEAPAQEAPASDIHATATTGHIPRQTPRGKYLFILSLAALGVVYGDIGTSPLYALRECFHGPHSIAPTPANILGVLSLIFWALVIVISVKYLVFVLRADNHGEGGILSLTALATPIKPSGKSERLVLIAMGIFGAALLYGDGVITPAISILGAMEGLTVATPLFNPYVVPITIAIIVALFMVQSRGTAGIGRVFGPVTLVWFAVLAGLGVLQIIRYPEVLAAINPLHGVDFFLRNGWLGFLILGSVVLVITGGEALYADMGHFGKTPIRIAWFSVVLPCVLLSYFGQGANVIAEAPRLIKNPFYALGEDTAFMYPMVVLATMAAVVASQALISGVFSLTRQAMLLGFSPRVTVKHTSADAQGQIYIPEVNYLLMVACIALVLGFRLSSALAAAYGIAVTGTMGITSILYSRLALSTFGWTRTQAYGFLFVFLTIDACFFAANINKLGDGGWLPLAGGVGLFAITTTWWRGRIELSRVIGGVSLPDDLFLADIAETRLPRVKGTAVFMASSPEGIPQVLLHHVKHNKVLHDTVILLSVDVKPQPWVPGNDSIEMRELEHGFWRVQARVGFMQTPRVPRILQRCRDRGMPGEEADTTYY